MRAHQFVAEKKIATFRSGALTIDIDDHTIERSYMRSVNPRQVDQALRKLKSVADQINAIEPGHKFYAVDPDTGVALGIRRLSAPGHIMFKTVLNPLTYSSDVPVIELPSSQQLDELSFLGSECTKDCSGHRAGYDWYKRKGYEPASWSNSFNKGAALAHAGK